MRNLLLLSSFFLLTISCQPSESLAATSISETQAAILTQTTEPTPLPTPLPSPNSTPLYTREEQEELILWCVEFRAIYNNVDEVQADVNEWLAGQGSTITYNDVQLTIIFSQRYSELYQRLGELTRYEPVREIINLLGDATYAGTTAYENLNQAYITDERSYYDTYVENKGEAERLTGPTIDLFNDIMNRYGITPRDCTRY